MAVMVETASENEVGVVVIGRNEGQRLKRCLESLIGSGVRIVYVDSASSDGSAEMAAAMGADVVVLDAKPPRGAGHARNVGFERLLQTAPDVRFVQFVDGDCEMNAAWLVRARQDLLDHPDHAIVTGRLCELEPTRSVYNRICDVEWNGPIGEIAMCGGIFMTRKDDFQRIGGFAPDIIAAQDDDFCLRMRQSGGKVWRLEDAMARHDAGMLHFRQWWRRAVRSGHAYAQLGRLHGNRQGSVSARRAVGAWLWAVGLPAAVVAAVVWLGPAGLLLLAAYPLMLWRAYRATRKRGNAPYAAWLFSLHCLASKLPQCLGQLLYWRNALRGRRSAVIDHKR